MCVQGQIKHQGGECCNSVDCFEDLEGIKAESVGFGKPCSFNSFLRSGLLLLLSLVMN